MAYKELAVWIGGQESLPYVALGRIRLMEILWEGWGQVLKYPQATPWCHHYWEKLHQRYRVIVAKESSPWF